MHKRVLYLVFFILITTSPLFCERYLLCPGEKWGEVSYSSYESCHFFDRCQKVQKSFDCCHIQEGNLELKYGVTTGDTLQFKGGYATVDEKLDGRGRGFNDFSLSWSHRLFTCGFTDYGMRIKAIIPVDNSYAPCLRYGEYGAEASLFMSQQSSIYRLPLHLFGDIGYLVYRGFPSDQVRSKVGITLALLRNLELECNSQIDFGLFNGKSRLDQSLIWMNPNYRLWRGEIELKVLVFNMLRFNVGYFYHFIGQNVGTGGGFFTKASLSF